MPEHFDVEYFAKYETFEYILNIGHFRLKKNRAYRIFLSTSCTRMHKRPHGDQNEKMINQNCLVLVCAILKLDIKGFERMGYLLRDSLPSIEQLIDQKFIKLKVSNKEFHDKFKKGVLTKEKHEYNLTSKRQLQSHEKPTTAI